MPVDCEERRVKHFLPYDCSRCDGFVTDDNGFVSWCEARESCLRFLSRNNTDMRTPVLINPMQNEEGRCDNYWEASDE